MLAKLASVIDSDVLKGQWTRGLLNFTSKIIKLISIGISIVSSRIIDTHSA